MTAAKRVQSSHPGRCRAASVSSVAEPSPSSTTDSVRRARRHVPLSITLNLFQCVQVSAPLRSRGAGAGRAKNHRAAHRVSSCSSAPPEPRANGSPHGRAPPAPHDAAGRSRDWSRDERARLTPLLGPNMREAAPPTSMRGLAQPALVRRLPAGRLGGYFDEPNRVELAALWRGTSR